MKMTKQAIISVSDKTGVLDFAKGLVKAGYHILSTGGTARLLKDTGIAVQEVSDYTGFPEMLDGRVKTLHPKIHAGILARRTLPEHMAKLAEHGIAPIDIVCVNLYPFEAAVSDPKCTFEHAIENIDIGGPTMIRAAAKNYESVTVVVDPADYGKVLDEIEKVGSVSAKTRLEFAKKVFTHTARYDAMISNYLTSLRGDGSRDLFPDSFTRQFTKAQDMRYGENPHQKAAFYKERRVGDGLFAGYRQLHGKELSYNNIADSDAAWECVRQFDEPACVIIKHANPCGVAIGKDALEAYQKAFRTDSKSAFGGIIAFNREVSEEAAQAVSKQFAEVVMAPGYAPKALEILEKKPNVRILVMKTGGAVNDYDFKRVGGGLLVQTPDTQICPKEKIKVVTKRAPSEAEINDMLFAWKVCKFVKSNTIVFCRDGMTLGVGAGQVSRVDSAQVAVMKAKQAGLSLEGSVVASDAYFPFRDGLDVLADAGAVAVIHPGGSIRDAEVVEAADEHGMAMVYTGERHFRH